jgi:hypothetical protein
MKFEPDRAKCVYRLALQRNHVLETGALRNGNRRIRHTGVFVADVLDEQQDQHVVLVLAGIHATAQFVAARPEGAIEFRFFDGHEDSFSDHAVIVLPSPPEIASPARRLPRGGVSFGAT